MGDIRVLYIVPSLNQADGISSYAMNYFNNIDKVKIDFLITSTLEKTDYCDEVLEKGCNVFYIKSNEIKNIFSTMQKVDSFFKEKADSYDIVHCHVASLGLIYLYYAKKYGINSRILHAHATVAADSLSHRIRNDIVALFTLPLATDYVACSEAAGRALFRNRPFTVIKNGIEIEKYRYSQVLDCKMRDSMKLTGKYVIGNVGRLSAQKNQIFLVAIAKLLREKEENFIILIIGDGKLEETIKSEIRQQGLEKHFMFLGKRSDVMALYNIMDVFVLPSLFEGLPIVGVEAQANGLRCLFSDKITREVDLSGNSLFLSIDKANSAEKWVEAITQCFGNKRYQNDLTSYNINYCAQELENYYNRVVQSRTKESI